MLASDTSNLQLEAVGVCSGLKSCYMIRAPKLVTPVQKKPTASKSNDEYLQDIAIGTE